MKSGRETTLIGLITYLKQSHILRARAKASCYDVIGAFDIETTNLRESKQAVLWHWQMAFDNIYITGRDWDSWLNVIRELAKLPHKIVVYVHNLSYEFQFIKSFLRFTDTLIIRGRKVLTACWRNIEFRCSYLLSNMSLEKYLLKWKVENPKLTLDYDKRRFPWTNISDEEVAYCINDVVGLTQAIRAELDFNNLTLQTIPLTSTGYVRREVANALHSERAYIQGLLPGVEEVVQLREAFRGGNTHANRYRAGEIISDVKSVDIASSYPYVMWGCKFPVSQFKESEPFPEEKAWIARFSFTNIRLKNPMRTPCPYLSASKCRKLFNWANDNGRVLGADYLEITMTDIDWNILSSQYQWEKMEVWDTLSSDYGFLPLNLTMLIEDMYTQKTELKGVDEYMYAKYKNLINALFGMSVQNPLRDEYQLIQELDYSHIEKRFDIDYNEQLEIFNKSAVMPYQWGVWVTAHARRRLQQAIDLVGRDFIYCDTDSVKYIGDYDFSVLNPENTWRAVDKKGRAHYLGVWEEEDGYKEFITWGAKKYAVVNAAGDIEITVAGVSKKGGAEYLAENGGLEAFKPGFNFAGCGGLAAWYNDMCCSLELDGRECRIPSNTYLEQSDYKLNITSDYARELAKGRDDLKIELFGGI